TGLLQAWPEGGPRLAWRTEGLGGGDSAPAVAKGRLYGLSNRDGQEIVWALSEADGKEVWASSLGEAQAQAVPQSKEGPGGTPTVDGNRLYVIGMSGRIACLDAENGKILWKKSLKDDFGGTAPMWNFRESPLVDGDKVICTPGASDAMLVALNKTNGEVIWKSSAPARESSGSPSRDAERPNGGERASRGGSSRGNEVTPSPAAVAGAEEPTIYVSEHWGMTGFNQKISNGTYLVKLHFAESYQGITGAGQRVFSFTVEDQEFKDFDIWEKAGGPRKAYVESIPVKVTDGELKISFKQQVENPAIKAIEILPQDKSNEDLKPIRINAGASEPFTDSKKQVWGPDQGFVGGQVNPGTFGMAGGFGPPGGRGNRRGGFGGFGGPRPGAAYSSVIAIDQDEVRQYVQLTSSALVGVSAENGEVLWQYNKPANGMGINCSTPIYQDGLVFAASAYGAGGGAVKLTKQSDGTFAAEEAYFTPNMQNHHGGMIVIDGALYGANGGNGGGMMACIDFQTGETLWRDRKGPKGSLLYADGRLYLRSEDGPVVLVEPSIEGLIEHGRFEQPDRSNSPAWAHPIIANGKLYIRDQGLLLCYDVSAN
ncbi:MAG: PQQ-binding-like beta-propeller repeat protein, partial [Planctomycetales bacterium]|nr:PQQ-binding-like beta-propeller repeat protein [Planctomycetales bacterium]